MNEEIRESLDEEIKRLIEDLGTLESGSEEYAKATKDLATLYKLRTDEEKTEREFDEKMVDHEDEMEHKRQQLADQKRARISGYIVDILKIGVPFAGLVLSLATNMEAFNKGLRFEQEGVFTSVMVKEGLKNFFRTHK